jgi:hypothetical protein
MLPSLVRESDWEETSYSFVTDHPGRLARQLERFGCNCQERFMVSSSAIQPAPQDMAVVRNGRLVAPEELTGWEGELLRTVRAHKRMGGTLLTLEERSAQPFETVEFRVDGRLVERVSLKNNYRHIEIDGPSGSSVFGVTDGSVRVERSSCRRELCKNCGAIESGRIVCAPNRLVATVNGRKAALLDAVTG